jgi:hypothetical protein
MNTPGLSSERTPLNDKTTAVKTKTKMRAPDGMGLVGIATGYGLDDQGVGVRVPVVSRIFTSPYRPDRLWGSPNLLYNGYRGLFPGGKAVGA